MPITISYVHGALPGPLADITLDYFGRPSLQPYKPAELGHWEVCSHIYWCGNMLTDACKGGHIEIVKMMMSRGTGDAQKRGFSTAFCNGHLDIASLLWPGARANWNYMLIHAAIKCHSGLAYLAIENGANNWDECLRYACASGDLFLIEQMIIRGANNWEDGLSGACLGGHLAIAKFMIARGATNWNYSLMGACQNGNKEIIELLVAHGADWCFICCRSAAQH